MHPNKSTSILIAVAVVAACVVPVMGGPTGATPKAKTTTATSHGPAAKTTTVKQTAAATKAKTATAVPAKGSAKPPAPSAKADVAPRAVAPKASVAKSNAPKPAAQTAAAKAPAAESTKPGSPKKPTAATAASTSGAGAAAPAAPTSTWTPNNPVAEKLATKSTILAKAKGVLPAGTDLNNATTGFKNFGQFVAAVNVSKNLGIPFADLKATMTGVKLDGQPTGKASTSLGGAIRLLRGDVDPMGEAQRATAEAETEVAENPTTTKPSTKTASAAKAPGSTTVTATTPSGTAKTKKKPVAQSASATR